MVMRFMVVVAPLDTDGVDGDGDGGGGIVVVVGSW
jgi:hypothetical protein